MIDIAEARAGVMAFRYEQASAHPLVQAFRAAGQEGTAEQRMMAVRRVLSEYYRDVQPSSALEIVGLGPGDAPGLAGIPLHSWVLPWSEKSIGEIAVHRRICLEEEGLAVGKSVSLADGATHFGPVSEKKLALETVRILQLAGSFETNGFRTRAAHPIEVIGLRSGANYRWFVVQGQHRLAACSAYGITTVPARITRLVRREDVEFWPHVAVKTFTVPGALKCFDRIFAGETSPCVASWLERHRLLTMPKAALPLPKDGTSGRSPAPTHSGLN
jgi:hypothetical protein